MLGREGGSIRAAREAFAEATAHDTIVAKGHAVQSPEFAEVPIESAEALLEP